MGNTKTNISETESLTFLLECLRKRGINANHKELQIALGMGHKSAADDWIVEHLGPETLLTREELSLYTELEKSGQLEVLNSQNLSRFRGIGDQRFVSAIEELQRCTAVIEKHTETLRTQQDALAMLVKSNRQHRDARAAADNVQYGTWRTEDAQINSTIDETMRNLTCQITELESNGKAADTRLRKTASEMLRGDDRLLSSLQKLTNDLIFGENQDDDTIQAIRGLCTKLIKYTVEGVRTRLDRIYLDAINPKCSDANDGGHEIAALRDELESLYAEILPVAQMSAEQQYLEPAVRLTTTNGVQGKERSGRAVDFIYKCLLALVDRLQAFTTHTEEYQNHRAVTMKLISVIRVEFDTNTPPSPTMSKTSSPTRLRRLNKPISPVRPRNARRRSSVISVDEDINSEQRLLRNLGISLPFGVAGDDQFAENLNDTLTDRVTKLNLHAKNLQESSETLIGSHIDDTQRTLQLLRQSLLSETKFKSLNLQDSVVKKAVGDLEMVVEDVKNQILKVDLEKLRVANTKKEDLVERWR